MIRMKEYRNRLVSNQRYSELFGVVSVVVSFRLLVKMLCVGDKQTHDSTLSFFMESEKVKSFFFDPSLCEPINRPTMTVLV